MKQPIRLVAFISIRNFTTSKNKIKEELPEAIVFPMFPKFSNWKKNYFLLLLCTRFLKPKIVIGRNVLATQLALKLKSNKLIDKVIYDGRGAISAEWHEYPVINDEKMIQEIEQLEKEVVLNSDFRIAVSNQLVEHWKTKFNYTKNSHVVIPCTINKVFRDVVINENSILESRKKMGFTDEDIVLIYSGSVAGWQSFQLLQDFIKNTFSNQNNLKIFFLSDEDEKITQMKNEFPNRVFNKKVKPNEVPNYLMAADYGLLIRENTITNKVASPVKFAEYLSCGLKIIISENLGDYSEFVSQKDCGIVLNSAIQKNIFLNTVSMDEKNKIRTFAISHFVKQVYLQEYKSVVEARK
ncbi:MAG: hypothetical protein ABI199_11470 [Bacteroidia bacterium]